MATRGILMGWLGVLGLLLGCTHVAVEDCGGKVLGENQPRIRSSHFRMLLADLPAAAERFAPYAAMSALAYAEDADCGHDQPKLNADERAGFEAALHALGWSEATDLELVPPCEDSTGLFARVWTLGGDTPVVVIAFRGTWGFKDWLYGNLHWLTRFLPIEDQYSRARLLAERVIDHYANQAGASVRFYTSGHSLGGGLAQHILYTFPERILQAIVFDPSSVTGFVDQSAPNQAQACACDAEELHGEARIYRVYDAYEVLAGLRIFHKLWLRPERHVQEVRFPNAASHSMVGLAAYLLDHAGGGAVPSAPWYAGKGRYSESLSCTEAFVRGQQASCEVRVTAAQTIRCPP